MGLVRTRPTQLDDPTVSNFCVIFEVFLSPSKKQAEYCGFELSSSIVIFNIQLSSSNNVCHLQDYGDRCVTQRYEMIGVQLPKAPPERLKLKIPECAVTDSFRYYLLLRNMFGDPPYKQVGGLSAEHYVALAAEHERDPYLHELRRKASEQENPTSPEGAKEATAGQDGVGQDDVGQDKEQVPPKGDPCAERSP